MKFLICAVGSWVMFLACAPGQSVTTMELHNSLVIVRVHMDGRGDEPMVLDTGAEKTIINGNLLGIRAEPLAEGAYRKGYRTPALPEVYTGISLARGTLIRVYAADMTALQKRIGYPIQGIVGQDMLSQFKAVRIDYRNHTVDFER
jgi:hypothetical protein